MHATAARAERPSRWSAWRELESRADRLASYGALAVGVAGVLALLVL